MTTESPKRRRWFQFRLRTLLIAILVLSVPLSWFAVEVERARRLREAVSVIRKLGGVVDFDHETYDHNSPDYGETIHDALPPAPVWMQKLVGNDLLFVRVQAVWWENSTDESLVFLESMKRSDTLSLGNVSNQGLYHLEELSNLGELDLAYTKVTDAGLTSLANMSELRVLRLSGCNVTDNGLRYLEPLQRLRVLYLFDTKVTSSGVETLQESLPDCTIKHIRY